MFHFVAPENWKPSGITLESVADMVVRSDTCMSVIAGPGAGKTELLAQRALYLLQTGLCRPPRRILAISFKRDAAKTLKERVSRRCSPDQAHRFDSYTFDAFAKSLVDRFLMLAPEWCRPPRTYAILFPSSIEWEQFLRGLKPPTQLGGIRAAQALRREDAEVWGPLPLELPELADMTAWVAVEWWKHCLGGSRPGLTFSMIRRLADAILRHNSDVLRALQLTYPYVFLDEFQDTTRSQYALTELAFSNSSAVLTAVGDTKQRIMTWAGAEAEVFSWFESRFRAQRMKLQMNHRSNRRIVQIINDLAKEIEPDAVETICGRNDDPVPKDAAEFWQFPSDDSEARALADFIADDTKRESGRAPDDFVLLVRVGADKHEKRLAPLFSSRDLRLRNEARTIEGVAIQDLLVDDLVLLILGLMKLALKVRGHEIYVKVQETLGGLLGTDFENPRDLKRLDEKLRSLVDTIQTSTGKSPADTNMAEIVKTILDNLGEKAVRRMFPQYDDVGYFRQIQVALAAFMAENVGGTADWKALIDCVEGKGQVRLMTIHKSKGLEYHTVIFVGLHHNALFSYRQNKTEETNVFFVALSRARERVYFTRSVESGRTKEIQELIDLLGKAGVPTVKKS